MSIGTESTKNINFYMANSLIDETQDDLEGLIIEKCFILYFNSNNQVLNKANEKKELINNLKKLKKENKINSIQIVYEVNENSEYYTLYSDYVKSNVQHLFTVEESEKDLKISKGSNIFENPLKL